MAGRRKGGKGSKRPRENWEERSRERSLASRAVFFPFPPLRRLPRRLRRGSNDRCITIIYSYMAAGANQICHEGVCTCSPGFAKNSDEECESKTLHLWLYSNILNCSVQVFLLLFL